MTVDEVTQFDGDEYVLMSALDTPVEIYVWEDGLPQMQEHTVAVPVHVESPLLSEIWPALSRHMQDKFKLKVLRTTMTATVQGKLPSLARADKFVTQEEDEFEPQEYRVLSRLTVGSSGYAIVVPVPPPQFFGRLARDGSISLLSDDDYEKVGDELSEIFDELADLREEEEAAALFRVGDSDDELGALARDELEDDEDEDEDEDDGWEPAEAAVSELPKREGGRRKGEPEWWPASYVEVNDK